MKRKYKRLTFVGIALVLLATAAALTLSAFEESIVFFQSPTDVVTKPIPPNKRFRLGGLVEEGSVKKKDDAVVTFRITDMANAVNVSYRGILPDLFREGQGVVTEGIFVSGVQDAILHEDGTFTQVLTLANGVATDLDAAFHIIAAVGSVDLETGEYTSGGRGSLKTIDLVNNAAGALRGIDSTLNVIADSRAQLGANLNRLEYTVSNLMNVSEFTAAARSRIEDADFAAESARLAKAQVLQQTGTAMLAQANAQPQLALSLIR